MGTTPIQIGTRLGPFEVTGQLGAGAAGAVHKARHTETGREVALKTLTPRTVMDEGIHRRFIREIAIAQKLQHPNIVAYDDCGVHKDILYYAMELVAWGSLTDIVALRQTLPWREVAECGREICAGLQYLHDAGIVHRDLKPANIFLSDDGRLKIGDFGLARDLDAIRLTLEGQTVGTANYLAPEQAMGAEEIDGRADIYALGCILFELVAGRTPFVLKDQYTEFGLCQMMEKHIEDVPPPLDAFRADCPRALVELVNNLLAKRPEERPPSAQQVADALGKILADPDVKYVAGFGESEISGETGSDSELLTERLWDNSRTSREVSWWALGAVALLAVFVVAAATIASGVL